MRIADLVRRQASARPHDEAIRCSAETLTWARLDVRVDQLAAALAHLPPGSRVGVLTHACHRHWETVFASSRAGLIAVPINYRWLETEIEQVLRDSGAAGLVVDLGHVEPSAVSAWARLPDMRLLVGFGGSHPSAADYEGLLESAGPLERRPASAINVLGYTSGTTGRPKGAALTATGAMLSAFWFATLFGLRPGDRFLACMPIYVYRGGAGGLAPFVVGATTVLRDFAAPDVLDAIERERITHCILAPIMAERILDEPDVDRRDLSSLRGLWLGGAPSAPAAVTRLQRLVGDIVGSVYGGTEATGIASMRWPFGEPDHPLLRAAGRPAPLMDVKLIAADGAEPTEGEPGEVVVRGDAVMAGYWPDVPGGGLVDGWFHTGDIARRDSDGYLFLVDRSVDIVNSGGLNVYSTEVESILLEHPQIVECAVVGGFDADLGEAVTAFVVSTGHLTTQTIDAHCRARLAGYKRPRVIVLVDSLPRNALGKIEKQVLRASLWVGREQPIGAPTTSSGRSTEL